MTCLPIFYKKAREPYFSVSCIYLTALLLLFRTGGRTLFLFSVRRNYTYAFPDVVISSARCRCTISTPLIFISYVKALSATLSSLDIGKNEAFPLVNVTEVGRWAVPTYYQSICFCRYRGGELARRKYQANCTSERVRRSRKRE